MAEVRILYVATARGLTQLANPGTSDRWRAVGVGLNDQDVRAVRASVDDPLRAFAGSDAGLSTTTNGGASWQLIERAAITSIAATSHAVYAGTADGTVVRSSGETVEAIFSGSPAVRWLGGVRDDRAFAIYADGSITLVDDDTMISTAVVVPGALSLVSSAAVPDDFFVVARNGVNTPSGFRTVEQPLTGAVVLLAGKPEVLLLGTEQSIVRSEDGGATFAPVEGPVDVRVLVSPARYQDYAYAGTGGGELWLSSDRGRSWRRLQSDLPPVRDLSFARVF